MDGWREGGRERERGREDERGSKIDREGEGRRGGVREIDKGREGGLI